GVVGGGAARRRNGWQGNGSAGKADGQHEGVRVGSARQGDAGGGSWGDLYRRGWSNARVSESRGTDGRAVCERSVRGRWERADVQDRGPGAMVGGRDDRVSGEERFSGEDPRAPDRVGRD